LKDRISTRDLLRRRSMELQDYNCVLCHGNIAETTPHLFINCSFASRCWEAIGLHISVDLSPKQNLEALKTQINKPFFMEIIILMSWAIWMCRNNKIFKNSTSTIQTCRAIFKIEMSLLLWRAKKKILPSLQEWIQNLD
jgi:hypothetical protein